MKCRFLSSAVLNHRGPHLVIVGRSNVGKSSLINHLFNNKTLAKVSKAPGKTRTINFFLIEEQVVLVDVPGYGYAKRSHDERDEWNKMMMRYFETAPDDTVFLQLIDGEIGYKEIDHSFLAWVEGRGKKVLPVFTKMDKIKKGARKQESDVLCYSTREGDGRHKLLAKIKELYGIA